MKFSMPIKLSRKNRSLALITVAGLATTGSLMATAPHHDANAVEEKVWPVTTMQLETMSMSPELRLFGRVETPRHAQLTAAVTAYVQTVSAAEGQLVEKGQVLMTLDEADEELRLQQRLADRAEAEAKLEQVRRQMAVDQQVLAHMQELHSLTAARQSRLEKLQQQNLVATEQLENTRAAVARQAIELANQQLKVDSYPETLKIAESALARANALLAEQELRLNRTLVTAPFKGRISRLDAAPGDRVHEGDILVSLYDIDALQVRVTLPNEAVPPIKEALAAQEPVYAFAGMHTLRLEQLAGKVAPGRSGLDGLFRVGNDGPAPELGKALDVTVQLPALENVAAIPVQSLYGDDRIYAVVEGRLQGVTVQPLGQRVAQDGSLQLLIRPDAPYRSAEILTTSLPRAGTGLPVEVIRG